MKVLCVNITLDPVRGGGTSERTFQLARFMALTGSDCSVLTLETGLTPERSRALVPAKLIALPCRNTRFRIPAWRTGELEQLVRESDVVHLMGHWNLLNVLVAKAALRLGRPYTVCPAGELASFGRSQLLKWVFHRLVGQSVLQRAAHGLAITPSESPWFAARGAPSLPISVLPNGIDPAEYQDRDVDAFRRRHHLGSAPLVLFLGRLNLIKGPDLLLNAFGSIAHRFPAHHLVFAGPDEGLGSSLSTVARQMGIGDRVHLIGHVRGAEKSQALHAASLLAIPSRREAMSIVVLEAGICGVPALITDACGFPEVEEVAGGVVTAATADDLATGLESLLARPDELPRLGARLKQLVLERYTWDRVARQLHELLESVAGGSQPARSLAA